MDAAYSRRKIQKKNKSAPGVFNPAAPERSAHAYRERKPFFFFHLKKQFQYSTSEDCVLSLSISLLKTGNRQRRGGGSTLRQRERRPAATLVIMFLRL